MDHQVSPRPPRKPASDRFRILASHASQKLGSHWAFVGAVAVVLVWLLTGPIFQFSNAWQLVINTGTTVITFLMVFLIQSTQNRDAQALHLKLDELIRSSRARNVFAGVEDATEAELVAFKEEFRKLRERGLHADDAAEAAHRATHRPRRTEQPTEQPTGQPTAQPAEIDRPARPALSAHAQSTSRTPRAR